MYMPMLVSKSSNIMYSLGSFKSQEMLIFAQLILVDILNKILTISCYNNPILLDKF